MTTYHRLEHCREIMAFLASLGLGYRMTARGVNVFEGRPRPMMVLARAD